jgi:protein TonB
VYGAKQPSGKGLVVGAIAGIAAVVVLGVALGLHFYHDHLAAVQAAEAHPPVVQTTPPAPVSAQPARLPEAPPPAAAANNEAPTAAKTPASETPLKAAPKSETGAGSGKPAKSEPTQSKLAAKSEPTQSKPAEEPAAEQEPVLHLTAAPAAKLHEGAEAPTLALASTADPAFPNLPAPKVKVNAPVSTIVPASLLRRVDPIYPQTAHNMSEDAVVKLTAIIAPSGDVASVTPLSGPMLFQVAAVEAVKRWKYKPATLNGKAVESTAEIVLKFAARR